jgi:hypothetical protein
MMVVARDGVEPADASVFRTRLSSVSNNFKGCRWTAKHWKTQARRKNRGVIAVGDSSLKVWAA